MPTIKVIHPGRDTAQMAAEQAALNAIGIKPVKIVSGRRFR
jgi:hypothetical protein